MKTKHNPLHPALFAALLRLPDPPARSFSLCDAPENVAPAAARLARHGGAETGDGPAAAE